MVDGGILLKITAFDADTKATRHTLQLAYVSRHVRVPYLSLGACIDLGLVPPNFPTVGSCDAPQTANLCAISEPQPVACSNTGVPGPDEPPCPCPRRTMPPTTPVVLPCPPTQENLPILKQYILNRYKITEALKGRRSFSYAYAFGFRPDRLIIRLFFRSSKVDLIF